MNTNIIGLIEVVRCNHPETDISDIITAYEDLHELYCKEGKTVQESVEFKNQVVAAAYKLARSGADSKVICKMLRYYAKEFSCFGERVC